MFLSFQSTSPKKICNLSTQSFSEIIHVAAFVDKTLFIKAFLKADEVVVALAPRRFGKSTNMDMVKEFLTGNKKLFQDNQLKIWKEERLFFDKYCQENPVIYVDFKNITGETKDELLQSLKHLIYCAFNEHQYLVKKIDGKYSWSDTKLEVVDCIEEFEKYWKTSENLSRNDVIQGLKLLSRCLHVYHNKLVYVLIDEFDSPFMNIIVKQSTSKNDVLYKTFSVIGRIMSITFKNNEHLNRGLINACVPVAEQVLSGDANNIQYYQFLSDPGFSPYFGFTDIEVKSLFEKEEFVAFNNDQVKKWYNGYKLMYSGDYAIYSCNSVLKYLSTSHEMKKPCFDNYWVDSASITHLKHLFGYNRIRKLIEDLIDGEEIEIMAIKKFAKDNIIDLINLVHRELKSIDVSDAHLFLQFLTENGYLNVLRTSTENETITIRIPNEEIRMLLRGKCYDVELFSKKHQLLDENIEGYLAALESVLTRQDKNVFTEYARAVSKLFDGAIMPQNEDEFYCILFVLAYNVKFYIVRSELSISRRKSKGRPPHLDLLMILNEAGLIVELKFADQSSEAALSQITTRQYESSFDNYKNVTKKILMGLHMTKEGKVSLTYTIGDSPPETVTSHE
jgi:hypothetical protein